MQIKEIMTPAVDTVRAHASLKEAARKMESADVGFLPVLSEGELVGVITDRDITVRAVAKGLDPEHTSVAQTMTVNVVSLPENSDIEDASDLMEERNVRRLVVTGEDDRPVGVISKDKLALYLGVYAMDNGIVRDTQEFPQDFDPAALADGKDGEAPAAAVKGAKPVRSSRDQGDPR
jgi:CBS domain-containing protein